MGLLDARLPRKVANGCIVESRLAAESCLRVLADRDHDRLHIQALAFLHGHQLETANALMQGRSFGIGVVSS